VATRDRVWPRRRGRLVDLVVVATRLEVLAGGLIAVSTAARIKPLSPVLGG